MADILDPRYPRLFASLEGRVEGKVDFAEENSDFGSRRPREEEGIPYS